MTKVTEPEQEPCVLLPGPGILSCHPQLALEDNDSEAGGGSVGHVMTVVPLIMEMIIVGTGDAGSGEISGAISDGKKSDGEVAGTGVVVAGLGAVSAPTSQAKLTPLCSPPPFIALP